MTGIFRICDFASRRFDFHGTIWVCSNNATAQDIAVEGFKAGSLSLM